MNEPNMFLAPLQQRVAKCFQENFGRTPLKQRLDDILGEAIELSRFTDMRNLKEELGDILASAIMCAEECGWSVEDLVGETLQKIQRRSAQYRSLGRKIKVAILGGAFDPVTLGHIDVAQYVLDTSRIFDEVWLMPCNTHMYGKKMASNEHRWNMLEIACKVDGRIRPFDYEFRIQHQGSTYELIRRLMDEDFAKHQYDFHYIIGMDNANEFFAKWKNPHTLEQLIPFVVVPRQGYERDPNVNWYFKPPHIYLGEAERTIMESASSEVRKLTEKWVTSEWEQARKQIEAVTNHDVLLYMMTNLLYGFLEEIKDK
jgi:nicotinate-nucleotide adenylyltransferase